MTTDLHQMQDYEDECEFERLTELQIDKIDKLTAERDEYKRQAARMGAWATHLFKRLYTNALTKEE